MAIFSRKGVPLLLLPRRDKALAAATIDLYNPQTAKARAAAGMLRILNRIGGFRLLPRLPGTGATAGILLCNPCHGTRCIALCRTADGSLEIVKAAEASCGEPLEAEHETLERVRGRPGVPAVGPLVRTADAVSFTMPWLRPAPRHADPAPLLRAWETDEWEAAEDNGLIRDLLPLLDESTRAALAGKTVRRALVHGDFAPWNWRSDAAGHLVCIDWEWARDDGFAGFDLVYCLVQQALLVKKVPSERLLAFVQRRLSELDIGREFRSAGAELTPDILVSLVLAYRKSKGMESPSTRNDTSSSQPGAGADGARRAPSAPAPRFLALEGADGVGKSTVLRLLVPELVRRGGFSGYLFFHWKPRKAELSYDAIPGDDPHDPRGKKPRNPLASLVFLVHHWLDFQLGYWRFIRPAIRAGRLVVADRYTYDVLLDPKRFRLKLPAWILRLFVRTIPRPDRTILLHADPEVIRTRKPELSEEEIARYQIALLDCPSMRMPIPANATESPKTIVAAIVSRL